MTSLAAAAKPPTLQDLNREARAAYDKGDYAGFLAKTSAAAKLSPGDVWILHNVACGRHSRAAAPTRTSREDGF